MSTNIIPQLWVAGSFEALAPFNQIVDPKLYYTVEGTDGVADFQTKMPNVFKAVYQPVGLTEADYLVKIATLKELDGAIITLTSKGNPPVYVPSNYIKSFPLVDGVVYEHICLITNLGAVPPEFKDKINSAIDHFNNYVIDMLGLENPSTVIGVVQTRGYVPKEFAEVWEQTRQTRIKGNPSDLIRLNEAQKTVDAQAVYITELEDALKT